MPKLGYLLPTRERVMEGQHETGSLLALTEQLAAQNARAAGHADATPEHGPWRITLDAPSFLPFMQHGTRRDLREELYRAYVTRASAGEFDNGPLLRRILAALEAPGLAPPRARFLVVDAEDLRALSWAGSADGSLSRNRLTPTTTCSPRSMR